MPTEKRIKILTEAEISELFSPPVLNLNDQRFFFTLNDTELRESKKIRERNHRCMFVVLLGYFKVKPVMLSPGYHQVKQDLKYVYKEVFPGAGFRPFNLTQKARVRIYQRIFKLTDHQRWQEKVHIAELIKSLSEHARFWVQPRSLFDSAIEFLSANKIAIPRYTVLQDLISQVVGATNHCFVNQIEELLSQKLANMLSTLVNGDGSLT